MEKVDPTPVKIPVRILTDEEQKKAFGYLEDASIAALKASKSVKKIHEVFTIDEDDEIHATYFTKPDLEQLQLLADYAKKGEEMTGLKVLFNTCRLAGSEAVLTDDEMKASAYKALAQLFQRREAIVKKR